MQTPLFYIFFNLANINKHAQSHTRSYDYMAANIQGSHIFTLGLLEQTKKHPGKKVISIIIKRYRFHTQQQLVRKPSS